jgi:hypothetical protein
MPGEQDPLGGRCGYWHNRFKPATDLARYGLLSVSLVTGESPVPPIAVAPDSDLAPCLGRALLGQAG